jgi:hypothetical protein
MLFSLVIAAADCELAAILWVSEAGKSQYPVTQRRVNQHGAGNNAGEDRKRDNSRLDRALPRGSARYRLQRSMHAAWSAFAVGRFMVPILDSMGRQS